MLQDHSQSTFSFAPDYPEKKRGMDAAKAYLQAAGYTEANGVMQKNGEPLTFKLADLQFAC